MNQNTCQYCGENFVGKRSDAKFCSSTCKAKFWEEKKVNTEAIPPLKLSDGLRGIVGDTPTAIQEPPKFYTKEIEVETADYKNAKVQLNEMQTSFRRLEQQKTLLIEQAKYIAGNNGGILYWGGAATGAYIADKEFRDRDKVLLGAGLGLAFGCVADIMWKPEREKAKQRDIAEINKEIQQIDVSMTSFRQSAIIMAGTMKTIKRYEKKTVTCPSFSFTSLFPAAKQSLPLPVEIQKTERKTQSSLSAPPTSDKIISSQDLNNMDYTALDFMGKWNILFGYPSVNFHCVLTGMSGEGKSTFAIQFASYLAENFGRVLYISGEEGFSKTFKDKLVNNNGMVADLYIADLRSYDSVVNAIMPDTYHFIFIDSLDNMRIDAEKMKLLRERYKESALITISQSTKDGKMRGSYEIVHDCDIAIKVENGIAKTTKNRFKEKGTELKVFGI